MYATSLLICAIFAQAPASLGDPSGTAPPPAATPPAAAAPPVTGRETAAPPFESGVPSTPAAAGDPAADPAKSRFALPAADPAGAKAAPADPAPDPTDRPAPPAAEPEPAAGATAPPADSSLVPVQPRSSLRNPASEVLNTALAMPEGSRIAGRPIALVDVLRVVPERANLLRATGDYWRLVEALAGYNFAWDEYEQLERLKPAAEPGAEPTADDQLMHTRMSAAKARLQDAELAIVTAQFEMAGSMKLRAGQPLPLPMDAPHVGPYRTLLNEIYQGRGLTPPARAVLLDRTLPIRRSAVDARAIAVQAAGDALDAAEEAHYAGRADLKMVLSLIEDLSRQRIAFFEDVRVYNNEIAEYAMGVPAAPPDAVGLASMLIRPLPSAGAASGVTPAGGATATAPGSVERAGLNAPIVPPAPAPDLQTPPAGAGAPNRKSLAPPASTRPSAPANPNGAAHPGAAIRKQGEPTLAPPRASVSPAAPAANFRANRLDPSAEAAAADPGLHHTQSLYQGLTQLPSDQQAKQLATVLFWQPEDATPDITPIALSDYISTVAPDRRKTALATYWKAQQMAATRAALASQLEQLDSLSEEITHSTAEVDPAAVLLVRAARSAAEADARRAEAECKVAQWELSQALGRPATGAWLAPATQPHAGGYRLKLEQLPAALRESTDLQRLAAAISRRPQAFCERAAALVSADKTRSADVAQVGGSLAGADRALQAIQEQTQYTLSFAGELAEYNRELADYALLVLPSTVPSQMLVQALVMTK